MTALQAAATVGRDNVIKYLLNKEADPNIGGGCFSHRMENC